MENAYSVYDSKAEAFLPPFFAVTDGLAVRMFQQAANDQEHRFGMWSDDYTLFHIGKWDDHTGTLSAAKANRSLGIATIFKEDQLLEIKRPDKTNGPAAIANDNPAVKWPEKNAPQR